MNLLNRIKPRMAANLKIEIRSRNRMLIWIITLLLGVIACPVIAQSPCTLSFVMKWSGEEKGAKPLRNPGGVCVDPEGYVYVADTGNHRLVVLDSKGKWVRETGGNCSSGRVRKYRNADHLDQHSECANSRRCSP